jgi:hypothetical protein
MRTSEELQIALGPGLQDGDRLSDELITEIVLHAALDLLTASQLRRAVLLLGDALQPNRYRSHDIYVDVDVDDRLSLDGDHDSAMASAGHGTDEDYGGGMERL